MAPGFNPRRVSVLEYDRQVELRVDPERMRQDFDALATFGATPDGGVTRPTFSDAHLAARQWFLARGRDAGLVASVDSAGNHSVALNAKDEGARTLLLGSHLDSVPHGGRFDGALGVIAALEVVRSVADAGLTLPVHLEAIDFTDEEGALVGLLGSRALAGTLMQEVLVAPRGGREALLDGLERAGLSEEGLLAAGRDPTSLVAYVELHIEQGPVLERAGVPIGVVTGITGTVSFEVVFTGEARHAGTTPMGDRRDALVAASAFVLRVREMVVRDFPGCVATVGDITVDPGAFNVVPGRARARVECRALDIGALDALEHALDGAAREEAAQHGVALEIDRVGRWEPVPTHALVRAGITRAAGDLDLGTVELPSGAGHDAQALAAVTPSGMVFVPSRLGISHDPAEETRWDDCIAGANVLLGSVLTLAQTV